MKDAKKRCLGVASLATAVATLLLIAPGLSEAQKAGPTFRTVGAARVPAVTAHSFGGKTVLVSPGPAVSGSHTPRFTTFSTIPSTSGGTMRPSNPYTVLPGVAVGNTLNDPRTQSPSLVPRDPSDIERFEDMNRGIANEKIDKKWLGGPDRNVKFSEQWWERNRILDISNSSCMWDNATGYKVENWGGYGSDPGVGNPLIEYDEDGDTCPAPDEDTGDGKGGDSGSKDTGNKDTTHKETDTSISVKESTPVKDETGKQDATRGEEEGDEPDELKSALYQEATQGIYESVTPQVFDPAVEMVSQSRLGGSNSGSSSEPDFSMSGTNTPKGLPHADDPSFGPNHEDRPDVSESSLPTGIMADPMSQASMPVPDEDDGPVDPGPTAGLTQASAKAPPSATGGITMANPMGQASMPAIGDDGQPVDPDGPEF